MVRSFKAQFSGCQWTSSLQLVNWPGVQRGCVCLVLWCLCHTEIVEMSHNCHGSATAVYTIAVVLFICTSSLITAVGLTLLHTHHTCADNQDQTRTEGVFAGQVHTSPYAHQISCLAANLCQSFPLPDIVAGVPHMSLQKVHSSQPGAVERIESL